MNVCLTKLNMIINKSTKESEDLMNYKNSQELNYDVLIWDKSIQIMKDITSLMELMKQSKIQKITKEFINQKQTTEITQETQNRDRLIPVTKWNDYYDFPTLNGLRQLIFREHQNGFNKVVRRVGGRVLIKEDEFFKWVENAQNGNS